MAFCLGRRAPEQLVARLGLRVAPGRARAARRALGRYHLDLMPVTALAAIEVRGGVVSIHLDLLGVPGRGAPLVPDPVMISHRSTDGSNPLRLASAITSLNPGKSLLLLRAGLPVLE